MRKGQFEDIFKKFCEEYDLKFGEDFVKGRAPDPDFYFPRTGIYVEIKFSQNGRFSFSPEQRKRFAELISKGKKVKILSLYVDLRDYVPGSENFIDLLSELKWGKSKGGDEYVV